MNKTIILLHTKHPNREGHHKFTVSYLDIEFGSRPFVRGLVYMSSLENHVDKWKRLGYDVEVRQDYHFSDSIWRETIKELEHENNLSEVGIGG